MLAHRLNPCNEGVIEGREDGVFDIVARHGEEEGEGGGGYRREP